MLIRQWVAGATYSYAVRAFDAARDFSSPGNAVSVTAPSSTTPSGCSAGINVFTGCYYNNAALQGAPVLTRTDTRINFDWRFAPPDPRLMSTYSVRWQGNFTFDAGDYTFVATTSDGMRIYVDGVAVLDRWRDQPEFSYTVRRTIGQGSHLIVVEYYERTGSAAAVVTWRKNQDCNSLQAHLFEYFLYSSPVSRAWDEANHLSGRVDGDHGRQKIHPVESMDPGTVRADLHDCQILLLPSLLYRG